MLTLPTREARRSLAHRPWVVPVAAALSAGAVFVCAGARAYPMDDAYIHFQYAHVLASTGHLEFNPGEHDGVGTTSPLWVWMLAAGELLGVRAPTLARVIGLASLAACAGLASLLALPTFGESRARDIRPAVMLGTLVGLSGNMVWFSLSGMETVAFVAAALSAFYCYGSGRWKTALACAGAAALLRPEGIAVVLAIAALQGLGAGRAGRPAVRTWAQLAVSVLPAAAWFAYVHVRTGQWLPTTYAGKAAYHGDVMRYFMEAHPALALFTGSSRVMYCVLWTAYACLYVLGASTVPGPGFTLAGDVGESVGIRCSWLGVGAVCTVMLPLIVLGLWRLFTTMRGGGWRSAPGAAGLLLWAAVHNAAYMLCLPGPGTATRYQAVNHVLVWWLVVLGIVSLRGNRCLAAAAACLAVGTALAGTLYWRSVYSANLDHMVRVRIAAASFVARALGPGDRVAAYDIGALRYYGGHDVVDLGGLTDSEFVNYQRAGRVPDYIRERGTSYVVLPGRHSGDSAELFGFAAYLGLDRSEVLNLESVAEFENDRGVWARGEQATGNYQPGVRIYRARWQQAPP